MADGLVPVAGRGADVGRPVERVQGLEHDRLSLGRRVAALEHLHGRLAEAPPHARVDGRVGVLEHRLDLGLAVRRFEVGLETPIEVLIAVVLVLQIDAVPLGALELPLEDAELLLQLRGVRGGRRVVAHGSSPIRTVTKVVPWLYGLGEPGRGQISP